jgi:hypothetical protein
MKSSSLRAAALLVSLLLIVIVPALATGTKEEAAKTCRQVEASEELKAFFQERGVEPKYIGKSRSEVPADQWSLMVQIVNTPDIATDGDGKAKTDDLHDVLNSLVVTTLWCCAHDEEDEKDTVSITIGNLTWCHGCDPEDEDV